MAANFADIQLKKDISDSSEIRADIPRLTQSALFFTHMRTEIKIKQTWLRKVLNRCRFGGIMAFTREKMV